MYNTRVLCATHVQIELLGKFELLGLIGLLACRVGYNLGDMYKCTGTCIEHINQPIPGISVLNVVCASCEPCTL